MLVRKLDPEKIFHAYGVDLQLLYPWEGVVETPFGAAWAIVPPGGSTKHHNHQEGETFFIARGRGVMTVGDESVEVGSGDVVFQEPLHPHTLRNLSDTEELLFLTVWWEDKRLWTERKPVEVAAERKRRRVLVTAAPPTPNGDLHLGHLSGPYLAGDIHTRYLRLRGDEAYYACGSDDNSIYVQSKGESLGLDAEATAKRFVESIEESFRLAEVAMDTFVHPNESPHHRALVQHFFRRLWETGKLEERETETPHCERCDLYLYEPYVGGFCPHCGSGVVGNTCEDCGRINDAIDIVEARCTRCGDPVSRRRSKRLFFPLSRYREELAEYHRQVDMPPHLRAFCMKLLADGLPDVAVTHPSKWGIPVPVDGYEDQRIYVWLEMAPRYFAYSRHVLEAHGIAGDWDYFWHDGEIVQCFGFDNSFYYSCFLPAMFRAFDPEIELPTAFLQNEFFRLDGLKFSTSRRHAIWARESLRRVPSDVVRFYLAWNGPETEGTNFTIEEFRATVERELRQGVERWLGDLDAKLVRERGGVVPSTGDWTRDQSRFYGDLERLLEEAARAYEAATFSPQRAARLISELVRQARRFGKAEDHWQNVPERTEERRTGLALELLAAKVLAIVASPIMPVFATRLWSNLGYADSLGAGAWPAKPFGDVLAWVPSGQSLRGLAGPYFPRVDELVLERDPAAVVAS